MWLLNARTRRLENFIDDRQMDTAYAILSHTWAKEEVGFDDLHHDRATSMSGYRKINYACEQALKDGIGYVWVDTCCIDKKSSAELSEAINSMYRWYYHAQVCYAFLEDVWTPMEDLCEVHDRSTFSRMKDAIAASRWFTRGWTLQELIAPSRVEFYDTIWNPLGLKEEVVLPLSQITGISTFVLRDRNQLPRASIAQRMAWASDRTTSRLEDQAYCLLGLFDVNIPLMYGEGKKAFVRLQEEIIQTRSWEDQDHSILAFKSVHGDLLASSPGEFGRCNNILRSTLAGDGTFELSKRGLRISLLGSTLPVMGQDQNESDRTGNDWMVMLDCTRYGGKSRVGLRLRARPPIDRAGRPRLDAGREELIYDRLPDLVDLSTLDPVDFHRMEVIIARKPFSWPTVSRHLVIDCPEAVLHLDNVCTARNCGFSSQCLEQYWTNESGHHVVLSDDGKVGRGRIKMALGSDGKLFTDFKVKFPAPRSDTAGRAAHGSATLRSRECPDILVHVEADVKTLPPVLVAYCRSGTSPSVDLAHQKLRVLPFGSPRTFKLDAGIDLHVKAGLSFETGDGVWRLDLSRAKLEAGCTTDAGAEDAPSASAAEHRSSPCSDNHHSGSPGSAVQQTISDAAGVRALQQELSDLRDDLWFLYQKSLCDNEDLAQRLENRLSSHRRSRGILPKGKSIASAFRKRARNTSSVAALHDDYVVVARPDETNAILEDVIFELEAVVTNGCGGVPAVAEDAFASERQACYEQEAEAEAVTVGPSPEEAADAARSGTRLMAPFDPLETVVVVTSVPEQAAAAVQTKAKPLVSKGLRRDTEAKSIVSPGPTEAAVVAQVGVERDMWYGGSGPFHELEAKEISRPVSSEAAAVAQMEAQPVMSRGPEEEMTITCPGAAGATIADEMTYVWEDESIPAGFRVVEDEMMIASVMNPWYKMIYHSAPQPLDWHTTGTSTDGSPIGDGQLTHCLANALKESISDQLLPALDTICGARKRKHNPDEPACDAVGCGSFASSEKADTLPWDSIENADSHVEPGRFAPSLRTIAE